MASKVANYISNLGKSVSYAAVDKFGKMSPTSADLVQTNSELFKEVTHNIINYKNTYKKTLNVIKSTKIYEAADTGINSIFEDLQTGKLWNKERIDKITEKNLGFGSDSFDDFNFDSDDENDFNLNEDSISKGDEMLSDMIATSSEQNAQMVSSTIARTGKYLANTQKTSTNILYTQNLHAYNLFNNNLSAINSNIAKVLNFNTTTIQTSAENSKKYFEESTKLMREQTNLLKQIADSLVVKKEEQKQSSKISYDDIMGSGVPDIKMYMKNVKKNFDNSFGSIMYMNSMMGEDSNMLEMFAASPLQFIPMYIINKIIPDSLEKSVKGFDNSLKGFFGSLIAKINGMKNSDNMLLTKIGEIFGISNSAKSSIETKNYNKGKVDWDGKSRKALIEVIPGYLSKILSAVSGKEERLYDYDEGKFVNASSIKKSFENEKKQYVKNASEDVLGKIDEYMKYITFNTVEEQNKLRQDIDKILNAIYDKGGFFDVNSKKTMEHYDYGVDEKSLSIFKTMFKNMDRATQLGLGANVVEQRDRQTKNMKYKEESADSILQSLFNGFNSGEFVDKKGNPTIGLGNSLLKTVDAKGNNIFYYLQNIWKELAYIRENGFGLSGNIGRTPKILYGDDEYEFPRYKNNIEIPDRRKIKPETEDRRKREREQEKFLSNRQNSLLKDDKIINISEIDDEKEMQRKLGYRIELEKLNSELKDKRDSKKSLIDKLLEADSLTDKTKTVIEKLNEITEKPMKFIVNTINKVDQRMYDLVFGNNKYKGQDVNGIFGIMKLELTTQFGKLNNFIDEKILNPIKQKLEIENMKDIGKKIFGMFGIDIDEVKKGIHTYLFDKDTGLFSTTINATKDIFKNAFEMSKNSLKTTYGPLFNKLKSKKSKSTEDMLEALNELENNDNQQQSNTISDTVSNLFENKKNINEGIFEYNKYEYTKGLKRLTNLDNSEQTLLENVFNTFSNKPMELDSLKFNALINLTKDLSEKDSRYGNLYNKLTKYNQLFNNDKLSIDDIIKNNRGLQPKSTKTAKDFSDIASTFIDSENTGHQDIFGGKVSEHLISIKNTISNIFDLLKSSISKDGGKQTKFKKPTTLHSDLVTNHEGKATFNFAQDLTNVIANWMYNNMSHYEQGGVIDDPQVATLNKGEVVLTPENVNSLLQILNDIQTGTSVGKTAKSIGLSVDKKVQKFVASSNISDTEEFGKFMSYSVEDEKMFNKIQELQTNKLYNKVFNIFNINLQKALEDYTKKVTHVDKDGIPTDPIQRAIHGQSEPFVKKVVNELYDGTSKVRDALFGTNETQDKKKFGEAVSDVTRNISKYAPEAIGASLLGGGVSLITGAIGGPLLGAAVGAGISLTKNSEKVQNWLFGEFDNETHERQGGVIPKKWVNKISKLAPDLQSYGIAGGLTGLLPMVPFGPVGGLLIGSSIAFAKNNEKAIDFLFGENGLIKPETRETVKKFLPKMTAGAAVGILTGPFGLVGNAAVGAAAGMLSSTETFNKFIFGEKDPKTGEYENGLLPSIRHVIIDPLKSFMTVTNTKIQDFIDDKIFKPIKEAFDPIKKDVKMLFKGMFDKIGDGINNMFEKRLGIPLNKLIEDKLLKPLKGFFGNMFKVITFLPKKIISAPFSLLGAYGKSRRKSHIRSGNADYMSAEERLNFRKTNKVNGLFSNDKFAEFDEMLVNMSDSDKQELLNTLDLLKTSKKDLHGKKTELTSSMGSEIAKYLSHDDSKQAMELIDSKGDTNLAKELIDKQNSKNLKLSEERQNLVKELSGSWNDKSISPSQRAKIIRNKQEEIYKLFDYSTAKNIEKLIKSGKFDDVNKMINDLRDRDNTKAFDLINLIDQNTNKLKMTNRMINDGDKELSYLQRDLKNIPGFENLDLTNKRDIEKYMNLIKKEVGVKKDQDPNITPEQTVALEVEQKNHKEIIDLFKDTLTVLKKIAGMDNNVLNTQESMNRTNKDAYKASIGKGFKIDPRKDNLDSMKMDAANKKYDEIINSNLPKELKQRVLEELMTLKEKKSTIRVIHQINSISPQTYLNNFRKRIRMKYNINENDLKSQERFNPFFNPKDREEDEKNVINESGLDSRNVKTYAKGGIVDKTSIAALSKGEYVHTPNSVDAIMKSVPSLLQNMNKNESENKNIFEKMLDRLTSLVKINKDSKDIVEKIDDKGNVMKFFRNSKNDLIVDKGDSSTRRAISEAERKDKNDKNIFAKFSDMFKGFIDKVNPFGKKDEKKNTFLDGLLSKAKTVAGVAAGITFLPQIIKFVAPMAKELWENNIQPFMKNTLMPWIKNDVIPFFAKTLASSISFILKDLIPGAFKLFGDSVGLSGEHGEESLGGHTGKVLMRDVVQGGRGVRGVAKVIGKTSPKTLKGHIAKGIGKTTTGALEKTGKFITKPFGFINKVSGLDKLSQKGYNKAADFILDKGIKTSSSIMEGAAGSGKGIIGKLSKKIFSFMESLTTSKIFLKLTGNKKIAGQAIAKPLVEWIERNSISLAAKISGKTAAAISTAGIINAVWAAGDFISGFNNAANIIGITQEPTLGMKLTAGTIKAINGLLLFGLIPENILVNLLLPVFSPIFDKDGNIQAMRESANAEVGKYNEEHGTDYSITQYNKEVLGKKTIGDKIKDGAKSFIESSKNNTSLAALNDDKIRKELGLKDDTKITMTDRVSMGAAGMIKSLTFGKVDTEDSVKFINGSLLTIQDKAKEFWTDARTKVVENFKNLRTNIGEAAETADKRLGSMFGFVDDQGNPLKLTQGLTESWKQITTNIKEKIDIMKTTALQTFTEFSETFKTKFGEFKENLNKGLTTIDNKLGSMLGLEDENGNPISLTQSAKNTISNVKTSVSNGWSNFKSNVNGFFSNLTNRSNQNANQRNSPNGGYGNNYNNGNDQGGFGGSVANGMVYYSQGDPDWADVPYGNGSMKKAACGPTSAAMVLSSLTKQNITPVEAAEYALTHGHRVPAGTSWSYFNDIGSKYGVDFKQTKNTTDIMSALKNNQPVIFSGKGAAPFTKGGHFIVGAGSDGTNINVNDPVSLERSKAYPSSQIFKDMATAFIANKQLDGNMSTSSNPQSQEQPTSIFNMLSDLQGVMTNSINAIYGFDNAQQNNSSSDYGPSTGLASEKIVNYIKSKEGFRAKKYIDAGGTPTIGYGTTGGPLISKSEVTEAEAAAELRNDINRRAAVIKKDLDSKGIKLKQNEFDALISFAYNLGNGGLMKSTLYKRILEGERGSALAPEFAKYNKAGGRVLSGLTKRRSEEASIFTNGSAPSYVGGGFGGANSEMLKYRTTKASKNISKEVENVRAGGFGRIETRSDTGKFNNLISYRESVEDRPKQSDNSITIGLIKSIINVLIKISTNTDNLQKIVELLADVLKVNIPKENIQNVKTATGKQQLADKLSSSIKSEDIDNSQLVRILNMLATE